MAASIAKPKKQPQQPQKRRRTPTPKQQIIIKTKREHPNLNTVQIAAIADTDHSHVVKTLQRYGINTQHLNLFKDHKADIIAGITERLLSSITDDDIKKSPLGSRILASVQLIDKEQLLRGLSTSNMTVLHGDIAALQRQERATNANNQGEMA